MPRNKFYVTAALKIVPDTSSLSGITKAINKALQKVPKKANIDVRLKVNDKDLQKTRHIIGDVSNSLKGLNVVIRDTRNQTKSTSASTKTLGSDLASLGHQAALATRRFGGFVVGTFAIRELAFAFKETFKSALDFQESLVKVGQVTKNSLADLKGLESTITKLSTGLGVDSAALIKSAQTLSQAGLTLQDTTTALSALAKSTLSPSFGTLEDTTEGLVSAMAQFSFKAGDAEKVLSSINAVAAKTAVESEDLIDVIKRTGGAFQATGGDLNELIGLFTSVRATTRESAGTISTGFRTIFTRLQRPGTIEFLESLGIKLRDANNQFIGGFEAVRKLSGALSKIPSTDTRFAQIVEELGGIRQVSKVIPLIQQFSKAQEALNIARAGSDSIAQDVIRSEESLARSFREVKEEFQALMREIIDNTALKAFIQTTLETARALLQVSRALVPLIPLFAAVGAGAAKNALGQFLLGTSPTGKRAFLPTLKGFSKGGPVGGIGSGDTVPAMLTPGEFVLKKSVVQRVGAGTLNAINGGEVRKFAAGGIVGGGAAKVALGGGALLTGLIATFGGLNESVQQVTSAILTAAASFLVFSKASQFGSINKALGNQGRDRAIGRVIRNEEKGISNIELAGEARIDKIFENKRTHAANLQEHANKRANIDQQIEHFSGFLSRTDKARDKLNQIEGGSAKNRDLLGILQREIAGGDLKESRIRQGLRDKGIDEEIGRENNTILNRDFQSTLRTFPSAIKNLEDELSVASVNEKEIRGRVRNEGLSDVSRTREFDRLTKVLANLDSVRAQATDPAKLEKDFFTLNPELRGVVPSAIAQKPNPKIIADIDSQRSAVNSKIEQLLNPFVSDDERQFVAGRDEKRRTLANLKADLEVAKRNVRPSLDDASAAHLDKQKTLREKAEKLSFKQSNFDRILNDPKVSALRQNRQNAKERLGELLNEGFAFDNIQPPQPPQDPPDPDPDNAQLRKRTARIARLKQLSRLREAGQKFNRFAPGISAAASLGGSFLSGVGSKEISKGNTSVGRNVSAAGGALSGLANGALLGSAFGPIGAGIGGAVGALAGFTVALIDADKQIESLKFANTIKTLNRTLQSVSGGTLKPSIAARGVGVDLFAIRERLSKATGDDLVTARGEVDNASLGLQSFYDTLAASSTSFDQFNDAAGIGLSLFSELSGIPLKVLNKNYKDQIDAQNEGIKTQRLLNQASFEFGLQLRSTLAFTEALANSQEKITKFGESFDNLISVNNGSIGGLGITQAKSIRSADFSSSIQGAAGFFGPEANSLFSELTTASRALQILPDVLLDIRSNPLESEGDIDLRLRKSLSANLGISPSDDVINKLINKFREIGGEEGDTKFLDTLNKDVVGVLDTFASAFPQAEQIFTAGIENINSILSQYGANLEKVASIEFEIINQRRNSIDTVIEAEKTLAGVFERDVDFGFIQNLTKVKNGNRNPQQLLGSLTGSRNRASAIQSRLDSGKFSNFAEGKALVDQRQLEINNIKKASDALNHLAEVSNTTSTQLDELGKLREDRNTKREFASSFVFGDSASKRDQASGIQAAVVAATEGIDKVPESLRDGVLQIFRQFSDVRLDAFGGKTGLEAEKFVLQDSALKSGLSLEEAEQFAGKAGSQEQQLQQAIVAGIQTSMDAQQAIQIDTLNVQNALLEATQNGFKGLVVGFRDAILEGQQAGLQARLQSVQGSVGGLQSQQQAFKQLSSFGISTPEQIKSIEGGAPQRANELAEQIMNLKSLQARVNNLATPITATTRFGEQEARFNAGISDLTQPLYDAGLQSTDLDILRSAPANHSGMDKLLSKAGLTAFPTSKAENTFKVQDVFTPLIERLQSERDGINLEAFGGRIPDISQIDKINPLIKRVEGVSPEALKTNISTQNDSAQQLQAQISALENLRKDNAAFGDSITQFNNNAANLSQTLGAFPSEVGHNVNGKVEVIINGAQVLEGIMPGIKEMINAQINSSINDFTRNNFPQLKPTAGGVRPRGPRNGHTFEVDIIP
jgi:TP901 family phage tail tape measure protein